MPSRFHSHYKVTTVLQNMHTHTTHTHTFISLSLPPPLPPSLPPPSHFLCIYMTWCEASASFVEDLWRGICTTSIAGALVTYKADTWQASPAAAAAVRGLAWICCCCCCCAAGALRFFLLSRFSFSMALWVCSKEETALWTVLAPGLCGQQQEWTTGSALCGSYGETSSDSPYISSWALPCHDGQLRVRRTGLS